MISRYLPLPVIVSCVALIASLGAAETKPVTGVDLSYIDSSVSPTKDFYDYANGAFNKVAIPGEYPSYGVNQELDERNFAILREILETSAKTGGKSGTIAQRVGDFYAAGMDEAAIEKTGLAPLAAWLGTIEAIKTPGEIVPAIGRLTAEGFDLGFNFGVQVDEKNSAAMIAGFYQGGLGLPERDYYFRDGAEAQAIRDAYLAHLARVLALAGDSEAGAKTKAAAIMAFETKLAKASRTLVERRDPEKNYNKFERPALAKLAPNFAWEKFFAAVNFPSSEKTVLVGQPEFYTAFAALQSSEPIETWRAYLRWHILRQSSAYLGKAFVDARFDFYSKTLSGTTEQRPRWKRVLAAADNAIGEDLGQLYVKQAFSPAAKERALKMVKFHVEAMRERLRLATWMSESTKQEAYKKLEHIHSKVGYPDTWRDYSALTLTRESYVKNAIAGAAFEFNRQLAKLGKPVDRNEWLMTPQTNNAYYDPTMNEICLTAGILQPPFFDVNADDATNYGALANTIGHELTHGFDDEGRQYDWQGNLKNWWTEADTKAFTERAQRIVKQYDSYEPVPGLHINGQQTLGENIADIGGLRLSYEAFRLATANQRLKPVDGFTPDQRFFIAFGQSWRTNDRPEYIRLIVTSDVHSPARFRVIGPLANFPEFYAAFGAKAPADSWPAIW